MLPGGDEIAGGREAAGEVIGDSLAGLSRRRGLGFFAGVEGAKVRMAVAARSAAVAAIGERERTQGRAVLVTRDRRAVVFKCDHPDFIGVNAAVNGASGHGNLQTERFGILGETRGSGAHF